MKDGIIAQRGHFSANVTDVSRSQTTRQRGLAARGEDETKRQDAGQDFKSWPGLGEEHAAFSFLVYKMVIFGVHHVFTLCPSQKTFFKVFRPLSLITGLVAAAYFTPLPVQPFSLSCP